MDLSLIACCMRGPSHLPSLNHSNRIRHRVQMMELFIISFSATSCSFFFLRYKYSH
jgi:hypothetical protein